MRKYLSLIILIVACFNLRAGVNYVQIGVNGLTCSACSRSVEMSIRRLDFVQNVEMNLENTERKITFKPNSKVDFEKIAQAVINAGFSVRYLSADITLDNSVTISDNFCYSTDGFNFRFFTDEQKSISGEV